MSRAKTKVKPHPFVRDPDIPPDQNGHYVCAAPRCHLIGRPGDAHHTMPEPVPDAASVAAGEKRDET